MSRTSIEQGSALRTAKRAATRLVVMPALALGTAATLVATPATSAQATARPDTHPRATRHHPHPHHARLGRSAGREEHAMRIAVAQKGKPYVYGAAGPHAYDCSGLTSYAFHHAGFGSMPRTSSAQAHFVRHIPRSQMHRGDLIFFTGSGGVYHVGLYAGMSHGHRLVLHAPHSGERVHTQPLWTNAWFAGTLRYR
jgi:cell wall-associated NlpC family hydrolase